MTTYDTGFEQALAKIQERAAQDAIEFVRDYRADVIAGAWECESADRTNIAYRDCDANKISWVLQRYF